MYIYMYICIDTRESARDLMACASASLIEAKIKKLRE